MSTYVSDGLKYTHILIILLLLLFGYAHVLEINSRKRKGVIKVRVLPRALVAGRFSTELLEQVVFCSISSTLMFPTLTFPRSTHTDSNSCALPFAAILSVLEANYRSAFTTPEDRFKTAALESTRRFLSSLHPGGIQGALENLKDNAK